MNAETLHKQNVDWFYYVNELSNKEFQELVIKLNNDLNETNFHVREQIEATITLIKINRMERGYIED